MAAKARVASANKAQDIRGRAKEMKREKASEHSDQRTTQRKAASKPPTRFATKGRSFTTVPSLTLLSYFLFCIWLRESKKRQGFLSLNFMPLVFKFPI